MALVGEKEVTVMSEEGQRLRSLIHHCHDFGFHCERDREPLTGLEQRSDSISLLFVKEHSDFGVERILLEGRAESRENVWEVSAVIQRGGPEVQGDQGSQ